MKVPGSLIAASSVSASAIVGDGCVIGHPKESRLRHYLEGAKEVGRGDPVVVGERCLIFNHVILYEGVQIGNDCVVEDRVRIGYDCRIDERCRLMYGAYLCDRVEIAPDTRIAGFVCDGSLIGARSTMMGSLVHEYSRPHADWWLVDEESPTVEEDSIIGYGAQVVGGVRVGPRAYVAAGSVVSRDVPPEHVVTGVNVCTPASAWSGRRLQELIRHWADPPGQSI